MPQHTLSSRSYRTLGGSAASFPPEFASYRVLPNLSTWVWGSTAHSFCNWAQMYDYPSVVLAPLIELYTSPDRGTRMALLDHLGEYETRRAWLIRYGLIWWVGRRCITYVIDVGVGSFTQQTGFTDTVAVIREGTVKSIILIGRIGDGRLVRDQAFKAVELFVKKLESHAATMVCRPFAVACIFH